MRGALAQDLCAQIIRETPPKPMHTLTCLDCAILNTRARAESKHILLVDYLICTHTHAFKCGTTRIEPYCDANVCTHKKQTHYTHARNRTRCPLEYQRQNGQTHTKKNRQRTDGGIIIYHQIGIWSPRRRVHKRGRQPTYNCACGACVLCLCALMAHTRHTPHPLRGSVRAHAATFAIKTQTMHGKHKTNSHAKKTYPETPSSSHTQRAGDGHDIIAFNPLHTHTHRFPLNASRYFLLPGNAVDRIVPVAPARSGCCL